MSAPETRDKQAIRILQMYPDIDSTQLGLKDLPYIRIAMVNVSAQWYNIGVHFGISTDILDGIRTKNNKDPDRCLTYTIAEWLKNWKPRFGAPSWRRIVIIVASRVGGDNPAEARKIAENYKSYGSNGSFHEAANTDKRTLKSDDQLYVTQALMDGVADKWMSVGLLFGLSYKTLQICELSDTFDEKVNGMVEAWLAKKYDVESFGEPSWRKLVEVVASRAGGSHQALAAKIARQHPIVNEAECHSSGAAAVRVESVPAPQLPADVLREGDLKMLVNELRGVAYKWMVLGQQLGLSMGELQNISASPMLLSGAPVTFFQQVLYIWLSFEPPTHSWPTITVLCEGLSSPAVEEEVLATQVRQRLSQRTCSIVTPPRTPQTSTSQSAIKRESPTAKVWKQRLKEYFDKKLKGKGVVKIRYENKQNQKDGRWSSIVYCPEIGMAEGDKDCPRKPAAEHSAAYNALKKLNALT